MSKGQRGFWLAVLLVAALPLAPAAWAAGQVAELSAGAASVEWQPLASYEGLVLTVSAPDGKVLRREFAAGRTPSLSLFDDKGQRLPDGSYNWELRVVPQVDRELRGRLAAARRAGNDALIAELRAAGKLPEAVVQSGSFAIQGGSLVTPGQTEEGTGRKAPRSQTAAGSGGVRNTTAADQVIPDDLIVQGSGCFGFDCVNNESFGFDTIRMKENNTRIKFEDTSVGSFPTNDWQLTANDSASGGSSKFSIEDITGAKVPFTITAGASTNSIFVDSTGRVGFRTSTPVLDLHVATSNTPAIRLEQNNSGGFTAQTWDVAGNEANFFIRDVTGGSKLSFRIRPGAPTSSLDISADGDVGVGTASPEAELHVFGSDSEDTEVGIGPDPDGSAGNQGALNIGYAGASFGEGAGFINVRPTTDAVAPNPSLRLFTANVQRMIVDNAGDVGINCNNPAADLVIASSVTGTDCPTPSSSINAGASSFTVASSRTFKEHLSPVEIPNILEKITSVNVYKYDFINGPKDRIGLMAEDFHQIFGRGSDKYLNGDEVQMALWLAVRQLTATNQELMKRVADLEGRLHEVGTQK